MRRGLDWYKRDPIDFLGGVQGLTARQIAVYTVALDLIYQHGGNCHNDPGWVAGWISDMGQSAVRKTLAELVELKKLSIDEDGSLTQKRAKTIAKTQQNLRETRQKTGRKGGQNSAKLRDVKNKNNDLAQASASTQNEADKNRVDKSIAPPSASPSFDPQTAIDIFNKFASKNEWPKCEKMNSVRRSRIKARLKDAGGIDGWNRAMERADKSDFLNNRSSTPFTATIDFLLQESSFTKLIEGNYDNRNSQSGTMAGKSRTGSGRQDTSLASIVYERHHQD